MSEYKPRYTRADMTALIQLSPTAAKAEIERAYRATGACMSDAAKALGCGRQTLRDWVARLGMGAELELIYGRAVREGWVHGKSSSKSKNPSRFSLSGRLRPSST
jgi:hypothetical protein